MKIQSSSISYSTLWEEPRFQIRLRQLSNYQIYIVNAIFGKTVNLKLVEFQIKSLKIGTLIKVKTQTDKEG